MPVYRVWNRRADSNHRYTTDRAIRDQMVARGETGLDAGRGFYDWSGTDVEQERTRASREFTLLQTFLATLDRQL